jgi:branched-chain amino acid transport system substrate-binding protein
MGSRRESHYEGGPETMISRWKIGMQAACMVALVGAAVAWPSSSYASTGNSNEPTYTLGLLTDLTGVLAPTNHTSPVGVKAAEGLFNAKGYKLKYVVADTGTSPTGALTAAQTLVEQDHVYAVIAISGLTFAASSYLTSQNVPVIGSAIDGNEWTATKNMFSVTGTPNFAQVETTTGKILKLLGAKNFAALGYTGVPSSTEAAEGAAESAQLAGIKVGYLNSQFSLGSTNVAPEVLAMKSAGVDSVIAEVEQSTSFALITGLRQEGVDLKAPLFSAGYGGDLRSAGPASEKAAQGGYFLQLNEPIELHTAATETLVGAMQKYAGVSADQITDVEMYAYMSVNAFIDGLKAAGSNPSQASFIDAMLKIRHFNGAGLYGSHTVGFAMDQRGQGTAGADNCAWVVRWSGASFHLVSGAEPICGTVVPGKTVSAG